MKVKRICVVLVAVVAACGGGSGGEPAAANREDAATTTALPTERGDRAEYLVHVDLTDLEVNLAVGVGDDRTYDLGLVACEALDGGARLTDVFARMQQEQEFALTSEWSVAMPSVVAMAATYICPEHLAGVTAELR